MPTLHYAVPLVGVADAVTLFIHRELKTTSPSSPPPPPPLTVSPLPLVPPPVLASNEDKVKKVIKDVLISLNANLHPMTTSLPSLASYLYAAHLITEEINKEPSMDKFINEFKIGLDFLSEIDEIQEYCQKFLNSFVAVRGGYANAARFLKKKWIEAIKNDVGIDFNININT